eukprot:gnl/TRDRNA2_/TRDRNA2_38033_c0_seq1.p1 gnl/TRDRNA2_/TRDRNA2_38033_c0~~gnl/TRDRNA2_/TRDRNA2_38033_c0_seq1.p1  ORF type:complete len:189 (-),score=41.15 gnl/TRDRNA2_/TRDRNA2_38033_c0_seq1:210-776(-)
MDSYSSRANTLFCTFVTVLGTFAVMNHLSSMLPMFNPSPQATVALNTIHDLTVNTYLGMDQCTLSFDMEHDLTTEFNWNMNQLFVYLVATYNQTSNVRNEVTLWDSIVTDVSDAHVKLKAAMVEYPMRDQHRELRGKDVRLHFRYRTMPITGIMYTKEIAIGEFKANSDYFRSEGSTTETKKGRKKNH